VQDPLWVSGDRLGDGDSSARLFADLVDVLAGFADDDGGVLGNDEATHLDLLGSVGAGGGNEGKGWV
jgi:hypothetical protein